MSDTIKGGNRKCVALNVPGQCLLVLLKKVGWNKVKRREVKK
jgi:hypothetical protein